MPLGKARVWIYNIQIELLENRRCHIGQDRHVSDILALLSYAQDKLLCIVITFRPSSVRPSDSASVRPVRPSDSASVRPSVNIFKRLVFRSRWANFAQISYKASFGCGGGGNGGGGVKK